METHSPMLAFAFLLCDWLRSMHAGQEKYFFTSEKLFWQPLSNGHDYGSNPSQRCPFFTPSVQVDQHSSMYIGLLHTGHLCSSVSNHLHLKYKLCNSFLGLFRLTNLAPCRDWHQSTWCTELTEFHFKTTCTRRGISSKLWLFLMVSANTHHNHGVLRHFHFMQS
mgnify:CR=1 FL=1